MSTPNQQNLVQKNGDYAQNFKLGDLSAAPAKQYAICMLNTPLLESLKSGFL